MVFAGLESGDPVGVDRPAGLEEAADPVFEILFTDRLGWMDSVVDEADAHASFDFGVQQLDLFSETSTGIGVDDEGVHAFKDGFIFRPAVVVDFGRDVEAGGVEGISEEHAAGAVFVFAIGVAGVSGDEEDVLLGDERGDEDEQGE